MEVEGASGGPGGDLLLFGAAVDPGLASLVCPGPRVDARRDVAAPARTHVANAAGGALAPSCSSKRATHAALPGTISDDLLGVLRRHTRRSFTVTDAGYLDRRARDERIHAPLTPPTPSIHSLDGSDRDAARLRTEAVLRTVAHDVTSAWDASATDIQRVWRERRADVAFENTVALVDQVYAGLGKRPPDIVLHHVAWFVSGVPSWHAAVVVT